MKHSIALAALATALTLTSPALAGTGPAQPAPASRPAQTAPAARQTPVNHHETQPQTQSIEALYRRAQQKLTDIHMYSGAIDGRRSNTFVASLEHFQRAHNIRANGRLNSETRAALGI